MTEQKFFKLVEKRGGKVILTDLDNNPLQPHEALKIARTVSESAQGKSYVYIGLRESDGLYKIGMTDNLARRQNQLGVTFVHTIECEPYGEFGARAMETRLHEFFSTDRVDGEWFRLHQVDVNLISKNCTKAQDTLLFLDAFDASFNKAADQYEAKGIYSLAADFVNNMIVNRMDRMATWYTLQKLAIWKRNQGKLDDAIRCETILALIIKICE